MIKERRNFYRLLSVQPDAPLTVIYACYHVLLQRLRLCGDQDFADAQAYSLNTALAVLQDPLKRGVYDYQLRQQYPIKKLSLGSFASGSVKSASGKNGKTVSKNRRNYYRVLQVQPDASIAIIIASYNALTQYPFQNLALLDEAFAILANPAIRTRYDALLAESACPESGQLQPANHDAAAAPETPTCAATHPRAQPHAATALRHCIFCYTPFAYQPPPYPNDQCLECHSPLPITHNEQSIQKHRAYERIGVTGSLKFYLYWPDTPRHGLLQDLSPKGMRFLTHIPLTAQDIIKIEAPHFKAVAEVAHIQPIKEKYLSIGVRFLVIKFAQQHSNFIVAHA